MVPDLKKVFSDSVKDLLNKECYFIGDYVKKLPLKFCREIVNEIGEDRVANALLAFYEYDFNVVIVDFGTAITFDLVTKDGLYDGGIIMPGISLASESLTKATAKLPKVAFRDKPNLIGKSTNQAIESGIYNLYDSAISGIIEKIAKEWQRDFKVVFTGGVGGVFMHNSSKDSSYDEFVTLKGLNYFNKKFLN